MNRLVSKFGKYTLATFIIMGAGLILFLVTPLLLWLWDFDSDVVGLLVFGKTTSGRVSPLPSLLWWAYGYSSA
jgi:hypothetical protein